MQVENVKKTREGQVQGTVTLTVVEVNKLHAGLAKAQNLPKFLLPDGFKDILPQLNQIANDLKAVADGTA